MTVTIYQAKTHLSRILQRVEQGEEVVVCRGKQAIARIVPTDSAKPKRPKVGVPTSSCITNFTERICHHAR
jgi:antitoxin (DNA-binding transcriptional repressor) of toxin-antitoxin stability system